MIGMLAWHWCSLTILFMLSRAGRAQEVHNSARITLLNSAVLHLNMDILEKERHSLPGRLNCTYQGFEALGSPTLAPGIVGPALRLDGANDAISLGNQRTRCLGNLSNCDGFTLVMWVKFGNKSLENETFFFSSGGHTRYSHGVSVFSQSNGIKAMFKENENVWELRDNNIEKSVWYHMVFTWRRNDGAEMYKNGNLVDEDNEVTPWLLDDGGFDTIEIGRPNNGPPGEAGQKYYGQAFIDELYVMESYIGEDFVHDLFVSYNVTLNTAPLK